MLARNALAVLAALAHARADQFFNVTALSVPEYVDPAVQSGVEIECRYDADFTILKWWKDHREFFRYEPGRIPSTTTFSAPGVRAVEVLACGPTVCRLRLDGLSERASGAYRCDLERVRPPPARYAGLTGRMRVRGGPAGDGPTVEGLRAEYGPGDTIEAGCTGAPGSRLGWYVNGQEVLGRAELRVEATRLLFRGSRAEAAIQCAELSSGGRRGSTTTLVRWREPAPATDPPPEEQRSAGSALHGRIRHGALASLMIICWIAC